MPDALPEIRAMRPTVIIHSAHAIKALLRGEITAYTDERQNAWLLRPEELHALRIHTAHHRKSSCHALAATSGAYIIPFYPEIASMLDAETLRLLYEQHGITLKGATPSQERATPDPGREEAPHHST